MFKMTFQVVELTIDANNNIIDRRVSPPRHTKHREALAAIESSLPPSPNTGTGKMEISGGRD
jgi:hypothetical protein